MSGLFEVDHYCDVEWGTIRQLECREHVYIQILFMGWGSPTTF